MKLVHEKSFPVCELQQGGPPHFERSRRRLHLLPPFSHPAHPRTPAPAPSGFPRHAAPCHRHSPRPVPAAAPQPRLPHPPFPYLMAKTTTPTPLEEPQSCGGFSAAASPELLPQLSPWRLRSRHRLPRSRSLEAAGAGTTLTPTPPQPPTPPTHNYHYRRWARACGAWA
jgi:hypothetical protein